MRKPHVLAIPYPAQGHVLPMLELMQCLAKHGFKVTFVNTEFTQERVINALAGKDSIENHIHLSIPDGLEPWEDRNELGKLTEAIFQIMPGKLEELIEKINGSDNDKITCIIADQLLGWALEVAEKMQIKRAAFWPAAAALLALKFSIPALLDDGIINDNGKTSYPNSRFFLMLVSPYTTRSTSLIGSPLIVYDGMRTCFPVDNTCPVFHLLEKAYPAQGHVLPLLELMQCLAKHGFKVTFVNTEFTHKRITNALSGKDNIEDHIHLVSIPDGLEPWEDRNEFGKLTESIFHVMPGKLEELIENINGSDNDKIPCIVADELLGWALEVAEKMQIKRAAFWSTATALLALGFSIAERLSTKYIISSHVKHFQRRALKD